MLGALHAPYKFIRIIMERRFVLFLVLSFLFITGYMSLMRQLQGPPPPAAAKGEKGKAKPEGNKAAEPKKPPEKGAEKKPAPEQPLPGKQPQEKPAEIQAPPEPAVAEQWITLGSLDPESPNRMLVTLTNKGAAVQRIELNSPRYCDIDNRSGYLGYVTPGKVTDQELQTTGWPVQLVGPGTPAAKAGLKPGDTIKEVNGQSVWNLKRTAQSKPWAPIGSLEEQILHKTEPGQSVALTIVRNGKELKLPVTLRRIPLSVVHPEAEDQLSMQMTLEQLGDEKIKDDAENPEANLNRELKGVALRNAKWKLERITPDEAVFSRLLPQAKVEVFKTYRVATVPPESADDPNFKAYHLNFEIKIVNRGAKPRKVAYRLDGPTGLVMEGRWYANKMGREWGGAGLRDYVIRFNERDPVMVYPSSIAKNDKKCLPVENEPVTYLGVDAQYFSAMLIPQKDKPDDVWFKTAQPICVGQADDPHLNWTDVSFRVTSQTKDLKPDGALTEKFEIFAGPKRQTLLANYGLDQLVYYGWPIFAAPARVMAVLLHGFYSLVWNYGLAIILLTMLVRCCMFPLSLKQVIGAQKMQMIQPEMKKIMEKYKKDLEARTRAMHDLYRKHNYHPASGCLPIFIQLPIFFGLYKALMVDVELRDAPLISHAIRWCSNLAAPDMLFNWHSFMPEFITTGFLNLGPYFNLLPVLTVFLYLWQQKKMMPPPTDDQQALQQKMMKYMMYFIGILFFKVASGLCLYFIISTLWGLGERRFMPKKQSDGTFAEKPSRPRWMSLFGSNGDDDKATQLRKERERKKK
jgi:YidC/Oxa1 family membrane protein insertase